MKPVVVVGEARELSPAMKSWQSAVGFVGAAAAIGAVGGALYGLLTEKECEKRYGWFCGPGWNTGPGISVGVGAAAIGGLGIALIDEGRRNLGLKVAAVSVGSLIVTKIAARIVARAQR